MDKRQNQQNQQPGQTQQPDQAQQGQSGMGQQRQSGQQGGQRQQQQQQQAGQSGGQQGGQSGAGQQQQFDMQRGQQSGGSGADTRFGGQIHEHMEVLDAKGRHCGTVDHLEGDRIKLTRSDSGSGEHRYIPMSQVAGIEGNQVHLRERGDNDFGMEA